MDLEVFRTYCLSLPDTTEHTPFGPDTLVFKKKDKMFALTNLVDFKFVNLKCEPEKALQLREEYHAVQPGYHMSKKHWNSVYVNEDVDDKLVLQWTKDSYDLI